MLFWKAFGHIHSPVWVNLPLHRVGGAAGKQRKTSGSRAMYRNFGIASGVEGEL